LHGLHQRQAETNHYQVNDSFYRLYGQLRQQLLLQGLPVQIHPERVQLGREDTAGWKMDTYQTTLNWLNLKTLEERSLNEAQGTFLQGLEVQPVQCG
ncbi:hypothetical protein AAIH23_40675, partial [Pseudomonas aeruginosa]